MYVIVMEKYLTGVKKSLMLYSYYMEQLLYSFQHVKIQVIVSFFSPLNPPLSEKVKCKQ